jgi:hypothetical protein
MRTYNDLYLAAFLVSRGARLEYVTREAQRTTFIFQDDGTLDTLTEQYHQHQANVDPKTFVDTFKNLRRQASAA